MSHHNDLTSPSSHPRKFSLASLRKIGSNDFGLGWQAFRNGKMIGTLTWVFHVQSTGILSRPWDQLLHFPMPNKPTKFFSLHVRTFLQFVTSPNVLAIILTTSQEITVTNYIGEAREYLKKLITAMGATTPSMTGKNTVLIAALYVLFPLPFLLPFFLLPLIMSSSLLSSLFLVTNTFHSACHEQKQPRPSPFHPVYTWLKDWCVQWRNLIVGVESISSSPLVWISARSLGRGVWVWDGGLR